MHTSASLSMFEGLVLGYSAIFMLFTGTVHIDRVCQEGVSHLHSLDRCFHKNTTQRTCFDAKIGA